MTIDIATLGLKVDASQVDKAGTALDDLATKGAKAETSTLKLSSAAKELNITYAKTASSVNAATSQFASQTGAIGQMTKGVALNSVAIRELLTVSRELAAGNTTRLVGSLSILIPNLLNSSHGALTLSNVLEGLGRQFGLVETKLNSSLGSYAEMALADYKAASASQAVIQTLALRAEAAITAADAELSLALKNVELASGDEAAEAAELRLAAAHEAVAAAAKEATLADEVLAEANLAAAETATAAAEAEVVALTPVAVVLAGILVAVGLVVGAFAIFSHEASKSAGDVTKSMGLTEKQLDRIKDKGVSTTVTFGDTFKAFFEVTGERLQSAFSGPLKWLSDEFTKLYEGVRDGGIAAIKGVVGSFTGAFFAIKAVWGLLPGAIGDLAISAANSVISAVEAMVNGTINRINALSALANKVLPKEMQIGSIGNVSLGKLNNPYAGKASAAAEAAGAAYDKGDAAGRGAVDRFGSDVMARARKNREDALRDAAGDPAKDRKAGKSDAEKEYERELKAAQEYLASLKQETAEIGKNRIEVKMMAADRAAAKAPTDALKKSILDAAQAWKTATMAEETRKFVQEYKDLNDQTDFENSLLGKNAEQRAIAIAQREVDIKVRDLERDGIILSADAIAKETQRYVDNAKAKGAAQLATDNAKDLADHIGHMNDNLQAASSAFADLFGTAGKGFADLMDTLGDYYQFQADQEAKLAEVRQQYGEQSQEYMNAERDAREANTEHELDSYGRVLDGVKNLFSQKSAAYKVMEGIEKAYAAVRLALAVREIIMEATKTTAQVGGAAARVATDGVETASSVTKSGIRAAADGVAAIAKAIASLPFPLNLIAGAATAAALVAFGVKVFGGGGGGKNATAAMDDTVNKTPVYAGAYDQYGNPTSDYSVLKKGGTTVAGANDNSGYSKVAVGNSGASGSDAGIQITSHFTVQGNVDSDVLPQVQQMLEANNKQVVQDARAAAASDRAAASSRQRIGGS